MQVLACALLHDLGRTEDGTKCGEVAAFCVEPAFRGSGRGDSLLDYIEQVSRSASDKYKHASRLPACLPACTCGSDLVASPTGSIAAPALSAMHVLHMLGPGMLLSEASCSGTHGSAMQDARNKGIQRLMLLTTRTADWFEQRAFTPVGQAAGSELLPHRRRAHIDPARNSKLFMKVIEDFEDSCDAAPAGKRIGF